MHKLEQIRANDHLLKIAESGFAGLIGGSLVDMREVEGAEAFTDEAVKKIISDLKLDNIKLKKL